MEIYSLFLIFSHIYFVSRARLNIILSCSNFMCCKRHLLALAHMKLYYWHFLKKSVFCPPEMSNTCKNFQNSKIGKKWLKCGTPHFSVKYL